jgi:single-stranded DNA-binding protein
MSLDILASGRLLKAPEQRRGKNGKPFATALLACTMDDGEIVANVIAFRPEAVAALLALDKGDAVAVAGRAKLGVWRSPEGEARPNVSIVADAVLTAYHVWRKREAVQGADAGGDGVHPAPAGDRRATRPQASRSGISTQRSIPGTLPPIAELADDLPWAGP